MRIYGIRHWIEQSYKQVKDELGWADFQVRSDTAIRRHQALVNCAFSFCWDTWFAGPPPPRPVPAGPQEREHHQPGPAAPRTSEHPASTQLAPRAPRRPQLADPAITLTRWWQAWSKAPLPAELQDLIDTVSAGHGLHLYLRP